ncbi:MAG: hypothetical protein LC107_06250 [Chitinophagales bacterium]|nr:hypothetical protein [Chitinophagales bacterium]
MIASAVIVLAYRASGLPATTDSNSACASLYDIPVVTCRKAILRSGCNTLALMTSSLSRVVVMSLMASFFSKDRSSWSRSMPFSNSKSCLVYFSTSFIYIKAQAMKVQ